jgi:hypothetical protein
MSAIRILFNPLFSVVAATLTSCMIASPSQAFELLFSKPNVVNGIKEVPFTMPSTGVTNLYNVTLKKGTINSVYGTPPKLDLSSESDAVAVMAASAKGINNYLKNVSPILSFGELGNQVFYLPYQINELIAKNNIQVYAYVSQSEGGCPSFEICSPIPNFVIPKITKIPIDKPVYYADIEKVPEPFTILGSIIALGIGINFKKRYSKKIEKQTA